MTLLRLALVCLLCLAVTPLLPHSVRLKNGRIIHGTIVAQNRTSLTIRVRGRNRTIRKTSIQEISYRTLQRKPRRRRKRRRTRPAPRRTPPRVVRKGVPEAVRKAARSRGGVERYNRWGITARSALLPGWGHYSMGSNGFAILYASLFVLSASYSSNLRARSFSSENQYRNNALFAAVAIENIRTSTTPPGDAVQSLIANVFSSELLANSYSGRVRSYNQSFNVMALVYVLQLTHSYFDAAPLHGKRRPGVRRAVLAPGPSGSFFWKVQTARRHGRHNVELSVGSFL